MTAYSVYMTYSVCQIIKVEADSIAQAIDDAWDEVEMPNISNRFEADGEVEPFSVTNLETGEEVWKEGDPLIDDDED